MGPLVAMCRHCGAEVQVPLRPGPSGAFRVGGTPVWCASCGSVEMVASRDLGGVRVPRGRLR